MDELHERDAELAALRDLIRRAGRGDGGGTAVVAGAGLGKTTLLDRTRRAARDAGLQVAHATAGEGDHGLAHGLLRRLLLAPGVRAGVQALLDQPAAIPVAALLESTASPDPLSLQHAVWWVATTVAVAQPVVIVADDVHWADAASLRALRSLARRLPDEPIALVVAGRPAAAAAEPQATAALYEEMDAMVAPAALSADALAAMARDLYGVPPTAGFARTCHRLSGGNPLVAIELLRAARQDGVRPVDEDVPRLNSLAPASLSQRIVVRASDADADGLAVAQAVAVLGDEARDDLVAALAGVEVGDLAGITERLAAAGVLAPQRPLAAAHPVLRTALLAHLSPGRRNELHARAAAVLQADGTDPERVAAQLLRTWPRGDPEVARTLLAAARAAATRGAPELGIPLLRRALAEPPAPGERKAFALELGLLEVDQHDIAAVDRLSGLLDELDSEDRARAVLALSSGVFERDPTLPVVSVLRDVADALDDARRDVRLLVEAEYLIEAREAGDPHGDVEAREARLLPQVAAGATRGELTVLSVLARSAVYHNQPIAKVAALVDRVMSAAHGPDRTTASDLPAFAAILSAYLGRVDEAESLAAELEHSARAAGSALLWSRAQTIRATAASFRGRPADAVGFLRAQQGLVDAAPQSWFHVEHQSLMIVALVELGDVQQAERLADAMDTPTNTYSVMRLSHARSTLAMARHDPAAALDESLRSRDAQRRIGLGGHNHALHPWRLVAVEALVAMGHRDEAQALAEEAVDLARAFGEPRTLGLALRALAAAAGRDVDVLREAVQHTAARPDVLAHARVLADLGAALRSRGARVEARDPLRTALDVASRVHARPLEAFAQDELVMAGARPRRPRTTGPDALTVSERRVAELVVQGLTNPDIAQALFVSRKTVEKSLTNVYRKLGVEGRDALRRTYTPAG